MFIFDNNILTPLWYENVEHGRRIRESKWTMEFINDSASNKNFGYSNDR